MKYPLIFGCTATLIFYGNTATAKSPAEVEKIVRSVSVEMLTGVGSGVIIHRQGNLYTGITNRHVVCQKKGAGGICNEAGVWKNNQLRASDGQLFQIPKSGIKLLKDNSGKALDLAIFQFRSNHSYPVAQVANPDSLKVGDAIYTAGFPKGRGWLFGAGDAKAVVNKRLAGDNGGYTVIYDAETLPGMSGGGAFDKNGRLVAVHGIGDRYTEDTEAGVAPSYIAKQEVGSKIGINRGIPVGWVIQGLRELGIVVGNGKPANGTNINNSAGAAIADEYLISGVNKLVEPGADLPNGRREAVAQFSQAIALNPRYTVAYFLRAVVHDQLQAYPQALADYNKVLSLDPKYRLAHYNRGLLKKTKLNDPQGALADFNQAIDLDPQYAPAYINRGNLKQENLNDYQGALADYDRAISLNPRDSVVYNNRGNLKSNLNDFQGALADFNQSISLDPRFAGAYSNRGILKATQLNDPKGALSDFDQAIALNPEYLPAYAVRGVVKYELLKDQSGGIADIRQAIKLAKKQGDTKSLQLSQQLLKSWGVNE
jgi:tetratricopeptide (TPR) repeat protein/S1-C subfamily serine protease